MTLNALRRVTLKDVGQLGQLCRAQRTKGHQNIPNVYREPAIMSGYRIPDKPFLYYAASIFHFHNESINVWTHIIATFIFVQKILHMVDTNDIQNDCGSLPLLAFCTCALVNSYLSALAHTFHSKSPFCHYVFFLLDYAGVGFYAFGQCILYMYISCPNDIYKYMSFAALPMNAILSLIVMLGGSISKLVYRHPCPFQRRLVQLGTGFVHGLFCCTPLVTRLAYCINDNIQSCTNTHHYIWLVSMVICLFFFSSHFPEKLAPGKFDFIGHSHQLFHVFQTLTVLLQIEAAQNDIRNNVSSIWSCHHVSGYSVLLAMLVYACGCVLIVLLLVKYVRKRIREDKKFA